MLQETHSSSDIEQYWNRDWGDSIIYSHGKKSDSCGVAILISPCLDIKVIESYKDDEGRFLAIKIEFSEGEHLLLCNIYAPTRNKCLDQLDFLYDVKAKLAMIDYVHLIMGGDYNTIFDIKFDKQGGDMNNCTNRYTDELIAFMETYSLIDAIRFLYPQKKIFTRVQRKPAVLSRIDHWLISSQLCNFLKFAQVHPGLKSDHSIITLKISKANANRGRGFWKFNAELLKDLQYVNNTKLLIAELCTKTLHMNDKGLRWDFIKNEIRGHTLIFSSVKNKARKALKSDIVTQINDLKEKLDSNLAEPELENYLSLKEELEKIEEIETQGAIMRARINWAEAGEKNTKYFLNLEKRNSIEKHIYQLQDKNGSITDEPKEILSIQKVLF